MEKLAKSEQPTTNLQKCYLKSLQKTAKGYEVSIYGGELTTECITASTIKLKKAFPALPLNFYDLLTDRLVELEFSDQRLIDSVNNVIDTCVYPTPTIANFISFDKRVAIKSYQDMVKLSQEFGPSVWNKYKAVDIEGKKFWMQGDTR